MDDWFSFLALLSAIVVVVGAPVVAAVAVVAERFADVRVERAVAVAVAVPVVVALAGVLVVAGVVAAGVVAAVVVALVVAPLGVGWAVAARATALPARVGRRWVVLSWPVALSLAAVGFVAPGGFARYNVLFLEPPLREVAVAVLIALAVFGPSVVVSVLDHRRRSRATTA
jgi:hypothetical protein